MNCRDSRSILNCPSGKYVLKKKKQFSNPIKVLLVPIWFLTPLVVMLHCNGVNIFKDFIFSLYFSLSNKGGRYILKLRCIFFEFVLGVTLASFNLSCLFRTNAKRISFQTQLEFVNIYKRAFICQYFGDRVKECGCKYRFFDRLLFFFNLLAFPA